MKKIYLLLFSLAAGVSLGQNSEKGLFAAPLDANGFPLRPSSNIQKQENPVYISSTVSYDSVRPLTELNTSGNAEAYPWLSPDGLRLYYTNGAASNSLYFTQRPNTSSYFGTPTLVPVSVSSPSSYWLSANELNVYIATTNSLYYSTRTSTTSSFSPATMLNLTGMPFTTFGLKGASLDAAENTLLICAFTSTANYIAEFSRTSPTSFNYVGNLSVPAGYTITPGQLSKDGLNYYVGADPGTGKTVLHEFSRTSTLTPFSSISFTQITGINNTSVWNTQPSMSDSLKWVAFVRCATNSWTANDLYIARKSGIVTSIPESSNSSSACVFPNPSGTVFTIRTKTVLQNAKLNIYDLNGNIVRHYENISGDAFTISTKELPAGSYYAAMEQNDKLVIKQKLIVMD